MANYDSPRKRKAKADYEARVAEAKKNEESKKDGNFSERIVAERMPNWGDGETRNLRIIPARDAMRFYLDNSEDEDVAFEGEADPEQEMCTHFNVGAKRGIVSCASFYNNEECAVDDEIKELRSSGDEDDAKYAKDMYGSRRYARFVIWRDNPRIEPKKVWAWEMSKAVSTDVMALYTNTKIQDLDLMFEGMDITVTRNGLEQSNTKYRVEDAREESYMLTTDNGDFDYEGAEEVYKNLPDIFEYNKPFMTYDEVKKVVNGKSVKEVMKERHNSSDASEDSTDEKPKRGRGRGRS